MHNTLVYMNMTLSYGNRTSVKGLAIGRDRNKRVITEERQSENSIDELYKTYKSIL